MATNIYNWVVIPHHSKLRGPTWDVVDDECGEIMCTCTTEHTANYIAELRNQAETVKAVRDRLDTRKYYQVKFSIPKNGDQSTDDVWVQYISPPFKADSEHQAKGQVAESLISKGHKKFTVDLAYVMPSPTLHPLPNSKPIKISTNLQNIPKGGTP